MWRRSKAYHTLEKGRPNISTNINPKNFLSRKDLVKAVQELITPKAEAQGYPLIIGEHGTGKTSLLWIAIKDMKQKPRGMIYANVEFAAGSPLELSEAIENALGLYPDKCN